MTLNFTDNETNDVRRRATDRWFQFVTTHDMLRQTVDDVDVTHRLSSGRHALCIPIERQREFLQHLAADLNDSRATQLPVLDLCEVVSPSIFRLFVKLQFCDDESTAAAAAATRPSDDSSQQHRAVTAAIMLERHRFDNLLVAVCIAKTVTAYFPNAESNDEFFHTHCLWRSSQFFPIANANEEEEEEEEVVYRVGESVNTTRVSEVTTNITTRVTNRNNTKRLFCMHMIWPHIFVTREQALTVRLGIIQALAQQFQVPAYQHDPNCRNIAGRNSWDAVVDRQVYFAALPMLGSTEYVDCEECLKDSNTTASKKRKQSLPPSIHCACRGIGRVPVNNSVYQYHATVNGVAELTMLYREKFRSNTALLLEQCCIRPDSILNGFANDDIPMQLPQGAPYSSNENKNGAGQLLTVDSKEYLVVQNLFLNAHSAARHGKKQGDSRLKTSFSQIYSSNTATSTANFLRRYQYASIVSLRRFVTRGGQRYYKVEIADNDVRCEEGVANYCHNVGRRHNCDASVYFKITERNGIVQKCRCKDDCCSASSTIACRMYESCACALPPSVQQSLFPPSTTTTNADAECVSMRARKTIDKLVARCARSTDIELLKRCVVSLERAEQQSRQSYEKWFRYADANQTAVFDFRDNEIKLPQLSANEWNRINELMEM